MAHESGRRDRPNGRHGNVNVNIHGNAGANAQGNANSNTNFNGFNGDGGWGQSGSEQIRDIFHVLFKRWRLILGLFFIVALPGALTAILNKPMFQATAKVMISSQRLDPTLQPTDQTKLENIQLNESLVNSEVQVISSRDLLERVVRQLAVAGDGTAAPHLEKVALTFGQEVLRLSGELRVTPIRSSNVIQIDYAAADAMHAARIVNRVVDEYLSYHSTVHSPKGLLRFYDDQLRDLDQQVRKADQTLLTFSEREGIVSPKDEMAGALKVANEMNAVLREVTTNISGLEERMRVVRDQIAAQPEVVKRSQSLEVNPVVTQLTTQLVDREVDRITLMRKYTDKDRHLRDNTEEISDLQSRLENELRERPTIISNQLYNSNPIREERLRIMLDIESSLREQRARQATLDEEISRANRQLISLRQKSVEYDRLEQDAKHHRDTYDLYVKRLQEARISQAMDEQRLVNVDVVQRPALPLPRAGAQGASAMLSIVAGIVVGIAGAFGREYMSRSLRSESDVSRHLGLPLLASISDVPRA